jgi:hypothetical protein
MVLFILTEPRFLYNIDIAFKSLIRKSEVFQKSKVKSYF